MPLEQFEELEGSPDEQFNLDGGFTATMRVMCDWQVRRNLVTYFLIEQPYYDRLPDLKMRCASVGVQPYTGQKVASQGGEWSNYASYEKAVITATFTASPGQSDRKDEVLMEEEFEPTAEFLSLDPQAFCLNNDGTGNIKDSMAPGTLVPMVNYNLTFYRVPRIPAAAISMMGCVNATAITSPTMGLTFPAETVLYHPPKLSRSLSTNGMSAWKLSYSWTVKPFSWNYVYNYTTGVWGAVYWKGSHEEYKTYTPANIAAALPR